MTAGAGIQPTPRVEPQEASPDAASFVALLADRGGWYGAPGRSWKAQTLRILAVATALLLAYGTAAAAVNPRAQFPWRLYEPLVEDYAWTKLEGYRAHGPVNGTLVLGSSRSLALPPAADDVGSSGYNFALPQGTLRDAEVVHALALRTGSSPDLVVVGFDTTLLRENLEFSVVQASAAALDYTGSGPDLRQWGTIAGDVFTVGYARDGLKVLDLTYNQGYPEPFRAFDGEGVEVLPRREAQVAAGTYDQAAAIERHWQDVVKPRFEAGIRPSKEGLAPLERLVASAAASGSQVKVFLTPFHPTVLQRLEGNPVFEEFHASAHQWVQALCGPHVQLFDFTDPATFGGSPDEFYDGYHITRENGERLMRAMADGTGRVCGGPV